MSQETRDAYWDAIDDIDQKISVLQRRIDALQRARSSLRLSHEDRQWERDQLPPEMRAFAELTERLAVEAAKEHAERIKDAEFFTGSQWPAKTVGNDLKVRIPEGYTVKDGSGGHQ